MSHVMSPEAVYSYVMGGNATFTVLNTETNRRVTYKVKAATRNGVSRDATDVLFVSVMTGSDNEADYTYIGILVRSQNIFRTTPRTALPLGDVRILGMAWLMRQLAAGKLGDFPHVEVRHHGTCGRCGRKLTVPESIDSGIGPECARHVNILRAA